jgi:hypothetical protein
VAPPRSAYLSTFVTASASHLCTWDAAAGTLLRCYAADTLLDAQGGGPSGGGGVGELACGCLDGRGRNAVVGDSRGRVVVVDVASGAVVYSMHLCLL